MMQGGPAVPETPALCFLLLSRQMHLLAAHLKGRILSALEGEK